MARLQKIMIGHGLLILLVAQLAGFALVFVLIGGIEVWPGTILSIPIYGTEAGWVRAHSGGTMNGILVVVIGLALPKIPLSDFMQKLTAWGFIYISWSFTGFYWFGNAAANRSLSMGDNPLGESDIYGVLGYVPGLISIVLIFVLLAVGAKNVLAAAKEET